MLKSQELHSATEKNNPTKSKRQLAAKRTTAQVSRWLHIYLSMVSFVIVLFFSVTGLTLNHADYLAGEVKTTTEKGKLNVAWVNATDTLHIAKLEVVEYLRKTNNIKGELSEFRIDDAECSLSFKGPGYGADVFIDRATGAYELSLMRAGMLPRPLHFAGSFAKLRFLSVRAKMEVARGLLAVRRDYQCRQDLDQITMLDWLQEKRQGSQAVERFWRQVLVSAVLKILG